MTLYYLLLGWIILLGIATARRDADTRSGVVTFGSVAAIVLIQGLRAHTVGVDLAAYLPFYEALAHVDYHWGVRWLNFDTGFVAYSKGLSFLGCSPQLYLGVVAATVIVPVGLTIQRLSKSAWMSFLLYVTLGFFVFSFSGLRQSIALGVCFFSLIMIQERRPFAFLLLVLLASTFHWSALVFLPAYPLYHMRRLDARWMIAVLGLLVLVYPFRSQIYGLAERTLPGILDPAVSTGAFGLLIGMIVVLVLGYLFTDSDNAADSGYLNLMLAAIVFQVFASESNTVMRAGYYYFIAVILLIPGAMATQDDKNARRLIVYLLCVVSIVYFQWKTAGGYLGASPYSFFWQ